MTSVVYGELQAAREGDDVADQEAYQLSIGSLLHMAQCVRPDIAVRRYCGASRRIGCILLGPDCCTLCGDAQCHPSLCFAVDASNQSASRCCKRSVPTVFVSSICSLRYHRSSCVSQDRAKNMPFRYGSESVLRTFDIEALGRCGSTGPCSRWRSMVGLKKCVMVVHTSKSVEIY
jgi:hypothetical protein